MFSRMEVPARHMMEGNLLLVLCCIFYLAWWLAAFRPVGALKGMQSGWLLIPAFLCGVAAAVQSIRGICALPKIQQLLPTAAVLIGGVVLYLLVMLGTHLLLQRPVTTELFLIVGCAGMMTLELNAFLSLGQLNRIRAVVLFVVLMAALLLSLICYAVYYKLDSYKGYVDGTIPLVMGAVITAVISATALVF